MIGRLRWNVVPWPGRVEIRTDDPEGCPAFFGRVVRGVLNGPSPAWLQQRLRAVGQRPISVLVDITNYVMLGYGRPLHVYDLDRLAAAGVDGQHLQLVGLRMALGGEDLRDGERRQLLAGVGDRFDLEADRGQLLRDLARRSLGLEMLPEPGEGELHAPTPPLRVGTSSAAKP